MNHSNDERTVRCPVDKCDKEVLARGLHLHVRQSSGGGHGPQGDVPDSVDLDSAETVGEQAVEMDYPEERDTENHTRLCPYCSQTFAGGQAMMIHLGQKAGRDNHPTDPTDRHEPGDFPRVTVDEAGNVGSVAEATEGDLTDDSGKGTIPTARVFRFIAELVADGEARTANRVRRDLLGVDHVDRPLSDTIPGQELYNAILMQAKEDDPEHKVSAALEAEGIMVACRGESAFYYAEEALDVAAGLEQSGSAEGSKEAIADLIEFLRYGADVLKRGDVENSPHEELHRWR